MKIKMVVWVVSYCYILFKCENYVISFQKYVIVDIFGKCGYLFCGVCLVGVIDCYFKFVKDYKFYLVFENFICKDYIIEKLFNFFFYDLVMILVINGFLNVYEYIFRGIYINVLDFLFLVEFVCEFYRIGLNEIFYV